MEGCGNRQNLTQCDIHSREDHHGLNECHDRTQKLLSRNCEGDVKFETFHKQLATFCKRIEVTVSFFVVSRLLLSDKGVRLFIATLSEIRREPNEISPEESNTNMCDNQKTMVQWQENEHNSQTLRRGSRILSIHHTPCNCLKWIYTPEDPKNGCWNVFYPFREMLWVKCVSWCSPRPTSFSVPTAPLNKGIYQRRRSAATVIGCEEVHGGNAKVVWLIGRSVFSCVAKHLPSRSLTPNIFLSSEQSLCSFSMYILTKGKVTIYILYGTKGEVEDEEIEDQSADREELSASGNNAEDSQIRKQLGTFVTSLGEIGTHSELILSQETRNAELSWDPQICGCQSTNSRTKGPTSAPAAIPSSLWVQNNLRVKS